MTGIGVSIGSYHVTEAPPLIAVSPMRIAGSCGFVIIVLTNRSQGGIYTRPAVARPANLRGN